MHRTLHRVEFGRWHHQVRERATALFQSQAQQLQWLQARMLRNAVSWYPNSESRPCPWARSPTRFTHPGMPTGQTSPSPSSPEKKTPVAPTARLNCQPNQTVDRDINGKQAATTMKDGTKLCPQFQRGGCKAKPYPQGAHRCAATIRKDRVCGAFNHAGTNCNSKR